MLAPHISYHARQRYRQRVPGVACKTSDEFDAEIRGLWERGTPVTAQMVEALGKVSRPDTEYRVCYDPYGRQLLLPVKSGVLVTVVRVGRLPKRARNERGAR